MLSNTKQTNPIKLAFLVLLAFLVFLLYIPLSGGAAHAPEWTSPSSVLQDSDVYLPLVLKNFPFTPLAPVLNPINNDDGDGNYTVTWTASEGAATYLLQEDDNAAFSSPATAYEGSSTTKAISGKDVGAYYYRVMASNAYASSGWSNVQPVIVSLALPACPQTGSWRGTTSQGNSISYVVENSPQCQLAPGSLEITYRTSLCETATTTFGPTFPITDNEFYAAGPPVGVGGAFTSSNLANGSFTVDYYYSIYHCYYRGAWEAYPVIGANGPVNALLLQPDGKILAGGDFSEVGRQPRHNIARLYPDGNLDATFNPEFDGEVNALAIQSDDKVLAGGDFNLVNGQAHAGLARLNPDGSLDTTFNPQIDGYAFAVAFQSNGKILVGGYFSSVNGQARTKFARLNSDGTLDADFNVVANYPVRVLVVQPDDKILVGGNFDNLFGEYWADKFVRLNADGTLDTSFQPYFQNNVFALALQADNKILVAGSWITAPYAMARYNSDGSPDASFNPPLPNANITAVASQAGGKVVVGGYFGNLDGVPIKYLAQLNTDGTLDAAFNPGPDSRIAALAVQPDNKILVGGEFSKINGQVRHNIVRLNPDGSLDESFITTP